MCTMPEGTRTRLAQCSTNTWKHNIIYIYVRSCSTNHAQTDSARAIIDTGKSGITVIHGGRSSWCIHQSDCLDTPAQVHRVSTSICGVTHQRVIVQSWLHEWFQLWQCILNARRERIRQGHRNRLHWTVWVSSLHASLAEHKQKGSRHLIRSTSKIYY